MSPLQFIKKMMEKEIEKLKGYLHSIVAGLVVAPEKISIESESDEQGVKFTVKVGAKDVGRVIGVEGAIAKAIRVVVRSAGFLDDLKASVLIYAPQSKYKLRPEEDPFPNERPEGV